MKSIFGVLLLLGPLSALLSCVFSDARHVAHRSSTVFFDEELSPAQLTSIGKSFRFVPFALKDCQKSDNHSESVRICDRAALFSTSSRKVP